MRYVIFWTLMLLLLWTAQDMAKADDFSFKMGPGLVEGTPDGSVKTFSLRREAHIFYGVSHAQEAGFWVDNVGQGRASSAFGKWQLGVTPGQEVGVYAKAFLGVGGITATDSQLGGPFQFFEDVGIGVRDETTFVEMGYAHISSAGIYSPNAGRDFVTFSVGIKL